MTNDNYAFFELKALLPAFDNYESLTSAQRVRLCYDLRESLNKATVSLDKLMFDALRSLPTSTGQRIVEIDPDDDLMQFMSEIEGELAEHPPLQSQKAFVHNEGEDAPLVDPEDIYEFKKEDK